MRQDVEGFTKQTFAFIVGAGSFLHDNIQPLPAAERQAQRLTNELQSPNGIGIPKANCIFLSNSESTKSHILQSLRDLSQRLGQDSQLVIYFAGHGIEKNGDRFLCCFETDRRDLESTSISATELDNHLSDFKVKGLLLILDCCRSAGFAESSLSFFRNLMSADFRILLSASRENQDSYEAPDGTGTLFSSALIDVISGKVPSGTEPGVISFFGLLEALDFTIEEDRRHFFRELPPQELVFSQSGSRDPVLFFHRQLFVANATVDTNRYSRRLILKKLRKFVVLALVSAFLAISSHLVWLDGHLYGRTQFDRVQVLKGYPGLNAWGYPRIVWEHPTTPEESSTAQLGGPADTHIAKSGDKAAAIEGIILALQNPLGQARFLLEQGDRVGASTRLSSLDFSENESVLSPTLQELLSKLATIEDTGLLEDMLRGQTIELRTNSAIALYELNPELLNSTLNGMYDLAELDLARFLTSIQPPCSKEIHDFLIGPVVSKRLIDLHELSVDTFLRLGCTASNDEIALRARDYPVNSIKDLALLTSLSLEPDEEGIDILKPSTYGTEPTGQLKATIASTYIWPSGPCRVHLDAEKEIFDLSVIRANLMLNTLFPDRQKIALLEDDLRQAREIIYRSLNPACDHLVDVHLDSELSLLISFPDGEVVIKEFMLSEEDARLMILLSQRLELKKSTDLFTSLLFRSDDIETKIHAIKALRENGVDFLSVSSPTFSSGSAFDLLKSESLELRQTAMSWFVETHPDEIWEKLEFWLGYSDERVVIGALSRLTFDLDAIDQLRRSVDSRVGGGRSASALLTMLGAPADAAKAISHPNVEQRLEAFDYLGYRKDLSSVVIELERASYYVPLSIIAKAKNIASRRDAIFRELLDTPDQLKLRRLSLILNARDRTGGTHGLSPGIRLALEAELDVLQKKVE